MQTKIGQLTFCTNIFPGETWEEHFTALKTHIPGIRERLSPGTPMGIGLRLSNKASLQLSKEGPLKEFNRWLRKHDCYVFTMNGFPYGQFHHSRVKDQVHAPDWSTNERLQYTLRLFRILAALLPEGMDGGVSTSPLSYKHWFGDDQSRAAAVMEKSTWQMVQVIAQLHQIYQSTGQVLHLDVEPEADGMIGNANEFIDWYHDTLLPTGTVLLQDQFSLPETEAAEVITRHLRLCYDVCHFAVGFEDMDEVLSRIQRHGIQIGKWQLSSALKVLWPQNSEQRAALADELQRFDEPVYLHQVVAWQQGGELLHYADLSGALADPVALQAEQWRSHFHVPLFISHYGSLSSTQDEVIKALRRQTLLHLTNHLEVETYSWDVLPENLKIPIEESIIREMHWVLEQIT